VICQHIISLAIPLQHPYLVISSYSLSALLTNLTLSSCNLPSRPEYALPFDSYSSIAAFHLPSNSSSLSARKPTHHPSKMTTSTGGSPWRLQVPQSLSGSRSPRPLKADLSYDGTRMFDSRLEIAAKTSVPSLTSCVEGWPRCCTSGLLGCDLASTSCSLCGRYRSSIEKTRVGRLYGGDDRVLESVVTYLVSAMGRVRSCFLASKDM
jgi:hypothetical protein